MPRAEAQTELRDSRVRIPSDRAETVPDREAVRAVQLPEARARHLIILSTFTAEAFILTARVMDLTLTAR